MSRLRASNEGLLYHPPALAELRRRLFPLDRALREQGDMPTILTVLSRRNNQTAPLLA